MSLPVKMLPQPRGLEAEAPYLGCIRLVERLHQQLLDLIKNELDRHGEREVNSTQALLLFGFDGRSMTPSELQSRGCYLGSNISYNLGKLVKAGYVHHERSGADRRSVLVGLTPKGEGVRRLLADLFARHVRVSGPQADLPASELEPLRARMSRLEKFWIDQIRFQL